MKSIKALVMLLVMVSIAATGCARLSKLTARVTPNTDLSKCETYYVIRHTKDVRKIDEIIRSEMQVMGLKAESGTLSSKPLDIGIIVTYEDRWTWDMSNYLLSLTIDLRDSKNNVLLATGQSYRTSMVRKSPEFMAREILESIFKKR